MNEKLNITQWAEEDRPREKMLLHGPAALSNAELLAILIGSGNTEETAVELMRKVLDDCHNRLSELGKYTVDDLCRYKGIGPAKAVSILAASELGRRRREEEPSERKKITSSQDVYAFFYPLMCDLPVEECWVMLLNQAAKVIDTVKISREFLLPASRPPEAVKNTIPQRMRSSVRKSASRFQTANTSTSPCAM
jgi:DNA repair protein RadC